MKPTSPTLADKPAVTDDITTMKLRLLLSLSLLPYAIAITVDPTSRGTERSGFVS